MVAHIVQALGALGADRAVALHLACEEFGDSVGSARRECQEFGPCGCLWCTRQSGEEIGEKNSSSLPKLCMMGTCFWLASFDFEIGEAHLPSVS